MTAPQIIRRALTFNFAPSINTATGVPDIMDVSVIPLASSTDAQAGATFAGGVQSATVELSNPINSVVFNLIPSYSPGLDTPINYRVMWRAGVLGPTTTYDFSMVDQDLTFDALISDTANIITGNVYLQQSDLGVPGRVARLDDSGDVLTGSGLICATQSDITAVNNSLNAEVTARAAAVNNLNTSLQATIATQTASTLATAEAYTTTQVGNVSLDVASERTARIAADTDLQTQISTNLNGQGALISANEDAIATINDTLPLKADLVSGKVPLSQIPEDALTNAVSAADQGAMLALSPTLVHQGSLVKRPDGIFLLTADDPTQLANWMSLTTVSSVNGYRGVVVLDAADVGAIPEGGAVTIAQVTGLNTALSNKANQTDLVSAQQGITAIQNDTTLVHTTGGVIPSTLLDANVVYLNSSGQLVHKDGTIIPLGSGGSGAVFSVNGQTGIVVLTAANVGAVPLGGSIAQTQVTGLSTSLSTKADLVSGTVPLNELPSIPQTQITGLSTSLSAKADLVSGTVPLAQLPTVPQSQVTGLSALVTGNQLTNSSNAIDRIASLESQIVSGGGGSGGGGVGTQAEFWTSPTTSSPVTTSDFSTSVNLHSPWGIDSDGSITGIVGTWYYLYTGVRSQDVAFAYISANGHLQLHAWNESGPADPTYALQSDLTNLTMTVGAKANSSDLAATNATVALKANQTDLTALSATVDTKAAQSTLATLTTTVGTKANQSDLNTTNTTVATKANQTDLTALATTVGIKANQSDLNTAQTNITNLQNALPTKADLTSGKVPLSELPYIPQTQVTGLSTSLTGKADLVNGTVPLSEMPQNIPQSYIAGLGTTLGTKADLVNGTVPISQLPNLALPNVVTVANQAAMLALTAAQVQYGDFAVITGTSAAGTYILAGTGDPSQLANWSSISTGAAPVTSVNGYSGTVVLQASDVGALASNASIPITQITGLSTQLATFATTTALTSGLAQKTAFADVQSMISASSLTKRADYAATTALPSLAGLQSVDGVLLNAGAIVLATAQPSSVNNGLWVVSPSNWTRATDYVTGSYLSKDTVVFVNNQTVTANGTTSNGSIWQMQSASGFIDSVATTWTRIGWAAAPFTPVPGNGITIAGSTFSANVFSGGGILANSSGLQRDPNIIPGKFVGTAPGGSTVAAITHNLNTTTPVVNIYDTGSNTLVLAGVTVTSSNSISIEFANAPATGQYRVVVLG